MSKIVEWIFNHRWAITPSAMQAIIEIAEKQIDQPIDPKIFHGDIDYVNELKTEVQGLKITDVTFRSNPYAAIEAIKGTRVEGAYNLFIRGKTAILPIFGVIVPRAGLFSRISGATSCEMIAYDFRFALEDRSINNIILDIDSPGGEVTGISELSAMIFESRNQKKIISYVSGMAASAAYWIASASSEMATVDTGEMGSIGVVAAIRDTSARDEKSGIKNIEIVSSVSPNKRIDPKTDAGRKSIQTIVDELAQIFVSAVAKHRNVSESDVINKFGQGGMLVGNSAINAGMADKIGSLDSLILDLNQNSHLIGGRYMNKLLKEATIADMKSENASLYQEIFEEGKKASIEEINKAKDDGFKAGQAFENKRIQEIEALSEPETSAIIAEHKFDFALSKEDVALIIVEGKKAAQQAKASAITSDAIALASQTIDNTSSIADDAMAAQRKAAAKRIAEGMDARRRGKRTPAAAARGIF